MADPDTSETQPEVGTKLVDLDWDWGLSSDEDEVLVCGVENPEVCGSCQ